MAKHSVLGICTSLSRVDCVMLLKLKYSSPISWYLTGDKVILFGDRVFAEVIKLGGPWVALIQHDWHVYKRQDLKTDMHRRIMQKWSKDLSDASTGQLTIRSQQGGMGWIFFHGSRRNQLCWHLNPRPLSPQLYQSHFWDKCLMASATQWGELHSGSRFWGLSARVAGSKEERTWWVGVVEKNWLTYCTQAAEPERRPG